MRRRDALAIAGAAFTVPPFTTRAQQAAMPAVGFLRNTSAADSPHLVSAFRNGLAEAGFIEGRSVLIEYRWTDGDAARLPALAADLATRDVSVIVALGSTSAARAAKAATETIPIVFMVGPDPVELGLVASLARPGGNLTGVYNLNQQLALKWLEVMRQIVPAATTLGLLVNPTNLATAEAYGREMSTGTSRLGLHLQIVHASSDRDFQAVFAKLRERRADALMIAADALFVARVQELAALSLRHALPAIYPFREFAAAGGLASFGTALADTYRLGGVYTGRILRGEKPSDLPVQQATKVELILNLKTAAALGLTIPPTLLARADEVIE